MQKRYIAPLILAGIAIGLLAWQNTRLAGALEERTARLAHIEQQLAERPLERRGTAADEQPRLLTPPELRRLRRLGLDDPVADLRTSLMSRPDLISSEGVLGGRMAFYDPSRIQILSERWVLAEFEDGHRAGKLLLEYTVSDGRIHWKVLGETTL